MAEIIAVIGIVVGCITLIDLYRGYKQERIIEELRTKCDYAEFYMGDEEFDCECDCACEGCSCEKDD